MSEKLTVAITAEIEDLKKKLADAQDRLSKFSNDTQTSINNITLDMLESDLMALNAELKNTAIGSVRFKELGEQVVATEAKINSAFQSIQKTGTRSLGGLNNSINQITRELPAFGLSANIGFLAISNNIPILIDEINRLKLANQQLAASGQPTQSVFKSITSAIFSLQTGLSIGVTLLTLYGGKFIEMISNIDGGISSYDTFTGKIDALNKAFSSSNVDKQLTDYVKLIASLEQVNKGIVSQKDFLDKYNTVVGEVTGTVKTFKEAEDNIVKNTNNYVNAIIARAAAEEVAKEAAITLKKLNETKLKNEADFVSGWQEWRDAVAMGTKNSDRELLELEKARIERNKNLKNDELVTLQNNYKKQIDLYKSFQKDFVSITNKKNNVDVNRGLLGLENMAGASQLKKEADDLFKLYKEAPQTLKLLGSEYANNPFFRDLINEDIKKQTNELTKSVKELQNTFLNTKRDDRSNLGLPSNDEIEKINENAQNLVNILGSGLTSAFDAALISGQNFGQVLVKAIGDVIKKLLAALAVSAILSTILGGFGIAASSVGSGATLFGNIFKGLTGFNLGGGASGDKVSTAVATTSNSGSVSFEIRGDKLYGVLQNYQGRLDRLI